MSGRRFGLSRFLSSEAEHHAGQVLTARSQRQCATASGFAPPSRAPAHRSTTATRTCGSRTNSLRVTPARRCEGSADHFRRARKSDGRHGGSLGSETSPAATRARDCPCSPEDDPNWRASSSGLRTSQTTSAPATFARSAAAWLTSHCATPTVTTRPRPSCSRRSCRVGRRSEVSRPIDLAGCSCVRSPQREARVASDDLNANP